MEDRGRDAHARNGGAGMSDRPKRKGRPQPVGRILADFLKGSALGPRVAQARIIPEWGNLVGSQIAAVTEPLRIAADGTLFVAVTTNAWMNELSLLEPQVLAAINHDAERLPVRKIRWQVRR
jgi:predicted nucleic acid-binding Zn ribbon protein